MAEMTRTFVAIAIPESSGQELLRLQAKLSSEVPGCRWAATPPFHVTLAFLGDVRDRDLKELCDAVSAESRSFQPLSIHLEGLGAFPSPKKPRVLWAGVSATDLKPLLDLREAVVRGTTRAGYRPDDPRFHPHVTLGRIRSLPRDRGDLSGLVERHRSWSTAPFKVSEIVTFASVLGPDGPSYAPLGRAPLAGKKN